MTLNRLKRMAFLAAVVTVVSALTGDALAQTAGPTPGAAEPNRITNLEKDIPAFIDNLAARRFDQARDVCHPALQQAMTVVKLQKLWDTATEPLGAFQSLDRIRQLPNATLWEIEAECTFENKPYDIRLLAVPRGILTINVVPPLPSYIDLDRFTETRMYVGKPQWSLPGTLTMPKGDGPFPAVVLVLWSAQIDRDVTVGWQKMYRDIAWGLASQGVAVLRYENRGRIYAKKMQMLTPDPTSDDLIVADAVEAVGKTRLIRGIDRKKVFVFGLDLSGAAVPRIIQNSPNIAGAIIMNAPVRPLEDMILEQVLAVANADGNITDEERTQLAAIRKQVDRIKDPALSQGPQDPPDPTKGPEILLGHRASYWLDLRANKPLAIVKTVKKPMLVLQGGKDQIASPEKDFPAWKKALADKKNATVKLYPKLNHLGVEQEDSDDSQKDQQQGYVSAELIEDIAKWVKGPSQ